MAEVVLEWIIGNSLKASILILMVVALRPLVKRVSHTVASYLWLAVGIALVCPISFTTRWSVIPARSVFIERLMGGKGAGLAAKSLSEIAPSPISASPDSMGAGTSLIINNIGGGDKLGREVVEQAGSLGNQTGQGVNGSILNQISNWLQGLAMADFALAIWLTGMLVILVYGLVRYLKLKKRLEISAKLQDNIYECDGIASPFVLGFFKPRIYLPSDLEMELWPSVVLHEQAHIRRNDPLWKHISLLLLGIHWFNPLVWISYVLLGRDMELACDEQVIKEMDLPEKKEYARALLSCSVKGRYAMNAPLAFAQVGVKERVVAMAKYQKPKAFALFLSLLLCLGMVGCSLTESAGKKEPDKVQAGIEKESETDYENQYNTPVKVVIDRAEEGQYQYSKGEKLLYADDQSLVFFTNDGIYRYVNQLADELSYGLEGSLSLKNIDQGIINGVDTCEIFMEANGMCVFLHPLDQPFMYSYDFGSYLLKLPYNLADQEVLSEPFETSFTADNGDLYTLEGTGGQLKDLYCIVSGSKSETRHLFRGEIEVDLKQKYLPHNQTKYGESAFFTEEEFDQAAEQIANSSKDWKITGLLKYDGDVTNSQMDVDDANLWASNAGIDADFNQSFSMSGQVHADAPWIYDDTDYEAGDYVGLWCFGKNPAGQILLLASHIYNMDDEENDEYVPVAGEEELVYTLGLTSAGPEIPEPYVFTEDGEWANGTSYQYTQTEGTYTYSFYGKKENKHFYVISPRIFCNALDDVEKKVQIKNGKVEENDYIKVKKLSLEKDKNGEYSMLIELDKDTPYYPMYLGVNLDGYRRVSEGKEGRSSFDLVDGKFHYRYEYSYRIELKNVAEEEADALMKDGELYFTQCYELCPDEHYSLKYGDSRIQLVKEADMIWDEEGLEIKGNH